MWTSKTTYLTHSIMDFKKAIVNDNKVKDVSNIIDAIYYPVDNVFNIFDDIYAVAFGLPILAEGAVNTGDDALFDKAISITSATYDGLSANFKVANINELSFNINTASDKISLNGNKVLYDADGTGGNSAVEVGTVSTTAASLFESYSYLKVGADGRTLTKNSGGHTWASGESYSAASFAGSGSVSAQVGEDSTRLMFGLSTSNGNQYHKYRDIDYAIYFTPDSNNNIVHIYEGGSWKGGYSTYTKDDVFSVKRASDDTITYYKNGEAFYTSTTKASADLHLETSIYTQGASLTNIAMSGDYNITFNDQATQAAVNDIVNAVTYEGSSQKVVLSVANKAGVSNTTATNLKVITPTAILDYGDANFVESSANDGSITGSMMITLLNDTFVSDATTKIINANSYTTTNIPAGLTMLLTVNDAGTKATATFTGTASDSANDLNNIGITFKADAFRDTTSFVNIRGNNKTDIAIDFADLDLTLDTSGSNKGTLFTTGEIVISNIGNYKDLSVNFDVENVSKALFDINTISDKISLSADRSSVLYDADGSGTGAAVVVGTVNRLGYVLDDLKGIAALHNGTTAYKDSATSYWLNGSTYSSTSFHADGTVSAKAGQTNASKMFGLSADKQFCIYNYKEIDYAIHLVYNGQIEIYEHGDLKVAIDRNITYTTNDVFSVERKDNVICYYKNKGTDNEVKLYTSTTHSAGALYLETAFVHGGASLTDITMTGTFDITFNEKATAIAVNDIINAVTYTGEKQKVTVTAVDGHGYHSLNSEEITTTSETLLLKYDVGNFKEIATNDGTVEGSMGVTLIHDTFTGVNDSAMNADNYTVTGVPTGLTMVIIKVSNTRAIITFTGSADAHINDVHNISINFKAAAFTTSTTIPTTASGNNVPVIGIDFIQAPTLTLNTSGSNKGTLFPTGEITIENDNNENYDGLKVNFTVSDNNLAEFDITTSDKISFNGRDLFYDADGTGAERVVGRMEADSGRLIFNTNATQTAVNDIVNAVVYKGISQVVSLSVTNKGGLKNTTADLTVTSVATVTLTYGANDFVESDANDGALNGSMAITLAGDTFTGANNTVMNANSCYGYLVPDGLTMVITKIDDTHATITFAGKAIHHLNANESNNSMIVFNADAFTNANTPPPLALGNYIRIAIDFIEVAPTIVETNAGTSLLGKAINLVDNDGYQGLSVHFSVTDSTKSTFVITSAGEGATAVAYDTTTKVISYGGIEVGTLSYYPTFTDVKGLTVNGNTLTKTSDNDVWNNGGSYTATSIAADGFISVQAGQNNKEIMFGLSSSNDVYIHNNCKEIDYAIHLGLYGYASIYEKGIYQNTITAYAKEDVFNITRVGNTISYHKNGEVFYTSTVETTETLYLETAFANRGGSLTNISMSSDDGIGNTIISFNDAATQAAVNAVTNAVTATYSDNTPQAVTLFSIGTDGKQSNSIINATSAANTIVGTNQDDTIKGLSGDDTITGGAGNDTLTGGTGSDIFVYTSTSDGNDIITDFTKGSSGDKLNLADLVTATTIDAELLKEINITDSNGVTAGGDLVVKIKAGHTSTYDGTSPDVTITLEGQGGTIDGTLSLVQAGLTAENFILS